MNKRTYSRAEERVTEEEPSENKAYSTEVLKHAFVAVGIIAVLLLAVTSLSRNVSAVNSGCEIKTNFGQQADTDCDGVPDTEDNCPETPNSQQLDSNRNQRGDACDFLIKSIDADPTTVLEGGEYFTLKVLLTNQEKKQKRDVELSVRNKGLEVDTSTEFETISPKSSKNAEFVIRIPHCTEPKEYHLNVETEYSDGLVKLSQKKRQSITVQKKGEKCGENRTLDQTRVELFTQKDLHVGEDTMIPVKITNFNNEAKTYQLAMQNINHIGSYRIDPTTELSIPSGETEQISLYIQTEENAPLGNQEVNFMISQGGDQKNIPLSVNIIKPVSKKTEEIIRRSIEIGVILVVLALIVAAMIISYLKIMNIKKDEEDEKHREEKSGGESEDDGEESNVYEEEIVFGDEEDFERYY